METWDDLGGRGEARKRAVARLVDLPRTRATAIHLHLWKQIAPDRHDALGRQASKQEAQ